MNEFITELINEIPFNAVENRSWFEIASILAPSLLFISTLFGVSFLLREKYLKKTIYIVCFVVTLFFLPYELFRQASEVSKADENINITQNQLRELLTASSFDHLETLVDKEVASDMLEELVNDLSDKQKQSLIFTGWLIAENETKIKQYVDGRYQSLSDDIKHGLSDATKEIIGSRKPTDKISDEILVRIDDDISQLIEQKMASFNQNIDQSLENSQEKVISFVQSQLDKYERALKNYSSQARIAFATQVSRSNRASLQKLEDTQKSVDDIGTELANANLKNLAEDVKHLSALMEKVQKKNEILFKYNECIRLIGLFNFSSKEERCQKELNRSMENL